MYALAAEPLDVVTGRTHHEVSERDRAVERATAQKRRAASDAVEAILRAAREIVDRDEVVDFNMRELLTASGVSNRVLYRHFPTKQSVVAALVDEVFSTMVRSTAETVARTVGAEARLVAWIDAALSFARDPVHRSRGRMFVAYEARLLDEHPEVYRSAGRALRDQVSAILAAIARERGVSPDETCERARLVVRLVVGTVQHHVLERCAPTSAERDALVAFVLGASR